VTPRRLFVTVTSAVLVLIVTFVSASLLGVGGNGFEDQFHNAAEIAAGLFASALAAAVVVRSRGRRRWSVACWSGYALLTAVCDWNALAAAAAPSG